MFVKICGINSPEAAAAAVRAGADALGFVFSESPREVTPERAKELCARSWTRSCGLSMRWNAPASS